MLPSQVEDIILFKTSREWEFMRMKAAHPNLALPRVQYDVWKAPAISLAKRAKLHKLWQLWHLAPQTLVRDGKFFNFSLRVVATFDFGFWSLTFRRDLFMFAPGPGFDQYLGNCQIINTQTELGIKMYREWPFPGLVNFVTAVAYSFCLNLLAAF